MKTYRPLSVFILLIIYFAVAKTRAQEVEGFALNRYDPPERGSDFHAGDSLDMRGGVRGGAGLVLDYGYRPLVLYQEGEDSIAVVKHQLFGHLGGDLILFDRLRLGVNMPLMFYGGGDNARVQGARFEASDGFKAGDLRLGADLRLLGEYEEAFTLALGVRAHLPTGSTDGYTSDGKVRIEPRLMAAGEIGFFVYAARLSFIYRALDGSLADEPFGSEIGFAASAGVKVLDKSLVVGPELFGSTVVQESDAIFAKATTPLEIIFGGKYTFAEDWKAGLGVGPGLTRGFGTPAFRLLASIEWFPAVEKEQPAEEPSDRDGDGVIDSEDACPDEAGVASEELDKNGCPEPSDRDGDGIADEQDDCPDEAGIASEEPGKNGCPEPADRDQDSIIDEQDACPDQAGVSSDDPGKNGCPLPKDRDGDGVIDSEDACPDEAGVASQDPKKNGCPEVVVTDKEIVVNERIEFGTGDAAITVESEPVLAKVIAVLREHPEITRLSIEGHTDNAGKPKKNLQLSRRRAQAVVSWLIGHGIDKGRLEAKGFGQDKPIDSNDTDQGRQNNRRVEFKIVK
ncbi:MAG: OmpA family protein [Deltaproteobacteria bacterium]|nr:OmpA family protein [Deltaproteobacteria bacterium]